MKQILFAAAVCCGAATAALPALADEGADGLKTEACHWAPEPLEDPSTLPAERLAARQQFADDGFGIFIHWGIYSMLGQGEWYMQNADIRADEYAKLPSAFYPSRFDARQWARDIKASGAKYVTFTSRHHDGFSMWDTDQSDYNIVDATPFGRDVIKELAEACREEGLRLHFYYSHIDWTRDDYPQGHTGHGTGRDSTRADWPHYYNFMNNQLRELLTNYGPVGAIWFDGIWDHNDDTVPFDWQLHQQYDMIHALQPGCLVINNHHEVPTYGEDVQVFERDIPGENTVGYSGASGISRLPKETCQTMNRLWGYCIRDTVYRPATDLIRYLVKTRSKGANLLLNVGPQPNGEMPSRAVARLHEIGQWTARYGETIYGTHGADFDPQPWGVATRKLAGAKEEADRMFLHVIWPDSLAPGTKTIVVPTAQRVLSAKVFDTGEKVQFKKLPKGATGVEIALPEGALDGKEPDFIIELATRP